MATTDDVAPEQVPHRRGIMKRLLSRAHSSKDSVARHNGSTAGGRHGESNHSPSDSDSSHRGSFKERARGHAPWFMSGSGNSSAHSSKNLQSAHAVLSRELWDEAYDKLRLDRSTAGLVVTYESIISQELPEELKTTTRGALSSSDGDTDRRTELMTSIATAGLAKRRGSKTSQVDDVSRMVVEYSKRAVAVELNEYPATALAWSGICVLTPVSWPPLAHQPTFCPHPEFHILTNPQLLIDPILHHDEFRRGAIHVIGRISWYMRLVHMLLSMPRFGAGSQGGDPSKREAERRYEGARDSTVRLYRRVLEFEMNCICATASAWNQVAKNAVRWSTIGELVDTICQDDEQLVALVNDAMSQMPQRQQLLERDTDLDVEVLDKEWRINEEAAERLSHDSNDQKPN